MQGFTFIIIIFFNRQVLNMHLVSSLIRRVFFFLTQDYFVAFHRTLLAAGFTNKHANKKHGTRMLCVCKKLGFFCFILSYRWTNTLSSWRFRYRWDMTKSNNPKVKHCNGYTQESSIITPLTLYLVACTNVEHFISWFSGPFIFFIPYVDHAEV